MAVTAEWFAGFFDGEGSINIDLSSAHCLAVKVNIGNTHLPSLKAIHQQFGGSLYRHTSKYRKPHHKPIYYISWHGNQKAKEVLGYIRQFAITKREQIDFILDCWIPYSDAHRKGRNQGYSAEVWQFKNDSLKQFREMQTRRYETLQ